jgi:hypothetical protein
LRPRGRTRASARTRFLPHPRTVKTRPRGKRGRARTSGRKGRPNGNFPPISSFMTSLVGPLFDPVGHPVWPRQALRLAPSGTPSDPVWPRRAPCLATRRAPRPAPRPATPSGHPVRPRLATPSGPRRAPRPAAVGSGKKKIYIYIYFFWLLLLAGKEGKKYFNFRFSIPKIPKIPKFPELCGLRGRSREKKKVFLV